MDALSKLDDFLLNSQVQTCSVAVPETSRNSGSQNRESTDDRFLGGPCLEGATYHSKYLNCSEQDETQHNVTGVQEEIPYCSSGTSSGKLKKARSTIQP